MINRIKKKPCSITLLLLFIITAGAGFGIILNAFNFEPPDIQTIIGLGKLEQLLNTTEIGLHSVVETSDIQKMLHIFKSFPDTNETINTSHNNIEQSVSPPVLNQRSIVTDRFSSFGSLKTDNDTEYLILRDMFTAEFLFLENFDSRKQPELVTENNLIYLVENNTWYLIQ